MPSTYALKAAIIELETKHAVTRFGWENKPVYFSVKGSGSELDNRRVTDGDLIILEVDWKSE